MIIGANAKIFCLLIRQNLIESQLLRVQEEIALLEKQIKSREVTTSVLVVADIIECRIQFHLRDTVFVRQNTTARKSHKANQQ